VPIVINAGARSDASPRKHTILVASKDPHSADIKRHVLESAGYKLQRHSSDERADGTKDMQNPKDWPRNDRIFVTTCRKATRVARSTEDM